MADWKTQFPTEFYSVPSEIEELVSAGRLIDISWGNDAAPSFALPGTEHAYSTVRLWVWEEKPEHRESGHDKRFSIYDHVEKREVLETDDVALAVATILGCEVKTAEE